MSFGFVFTGSRYVGSHIARVEFSRAACRSVAPAVANAAFGAALIDVELGWDTVNTVAVCAKPFHMRRAIMTLRKHFPAHVRLIAQPPNDPGDLSAETWWQTEGGRQRVLGELGKISEYALKGDLGDV